MENSSARALDAPEPFLEATPFKLRSYLTARIAFTSNDTGPAEIALLALLDKLPRASLLPIDFSGVRVSSEAARQFLRRALLRITTGELEDRYLVLDKLGDSMYNVDVMLESEQLIVVERAEHGPPELRGDVDPAIRATYEYLLSVPTATASMVQRSLKLSNISTATNRLTSLNKIGVARRVEHRPVSSGGREYVYTAVK